MSWPLLRVLSKSWEVLESKEVVETAQRQADDDSGSSENLVNRVMYVKGDLKEPRPQVSKSVSAVVL